MVNNNGNNNSPVCPSFNHFNYSPFRMFDACFEEIAFIIFDFFCLYLLGIFIITVTKLRQMFS